ncbi:hypothetical protein ACVWW5_003049 [Bradyrhizobium sp. LM3.4]
MSIHDDREQQIDLAVLALPLQRAEEGKQDLADLQDTDIGRFLQALRNAIETDELRLQQRAEQISIGLPRKQRTALCGNLPSAEPNQPAERLAMQCWRSQPLAHLAARPSQGQQQADCQSQRLATQECRCARRGRDQEEHRKSRNHGADDADRGDPAIVLPCGEQRNEDRRYTLAQPADTGQRERQSEIVGGRTGQMKSETRKRSPGNQKENDDRPARTDREHDRGREQASRIVAVGWLQSLCKFARRRQAERVAEHQCWRNACGD